MSEYGTKLFNLFNKYHKPSSSFDNVVNGFLSIKKFTNETVPSSKDIDNGIFLKETFQLVFSPTGSLYFIKLENGKPTGEILSKFLNPIVPDDVNFEENWTSWKPIDPKLFLNYNNNVNVQYFLSMTSNLGYGVEGSGFILYRDQPYTDESSEGDYYLLINPFNRPQNVYGNVLINDNKNYNSLDFYCKKVQYQDPICYCSYGFGDNRCVYGFTQGQTYGDSILSSDIASNPQNAIAMQTIKSHCGCNPVCKSFGGYNSITDKPSCAEVGNLSLCATGFSTGTGSTLNLPNLTINSNCGNSPTPSPKPDQSHSKGLNPLFIIIPVSLILILILVYFIFLK